MAIPVFQVDAFTNRIFGGNPAAICLLDDWLPDATLQAIAAEHNLSETAYLRRTSPGVYDLRWFTPAVEVDLCGHATLASALVVFDHLEPWLNEVGFDTRSGRLVVRREGGRLSMDFPAPARSLRDTDIADRGVAPAAATGAPIARFSGGVCDRRGSTFARAGYELARTGAQPGRHRHGAWQGGRLRLPIFRATSRHRRRPRHWFGALDARSLLGRTTSKATVARAASLASRGRTVVYAPWRARQHRRSRGALFARHDPDLTARPLPPLARLLLAGRPTST